MRRFISLAAFASLGNVLASGIALAGGINTGEATGAYHTTFCPRLEAELQKSRFPHTCTTSQGTTENLKRVAADPQQIGFGQLDILALEGVTVGSPAPITILRRDDARECLFAVTRNKDIAAYGDLAGNASRLRFILPPADSGSAGTFRYLRSIDPDGIGRANNVTHASATDEAIRQALSADDTVTLFVQFADPDNARFKLVSELGGHFVPVIDRAILRPQVGSEKVYFAQETEVADAGWSKAGVKVVTACTPLVVFTGATENIPGEKAQQDHRDLIATVRALRPDVMVPPESAFAHFLKRTKELSSIGAEQLLKYSEEARQRAKPMLERAREASEKAIEAAKPALEKAAEKSKERIDRAAQEAKEMLDKSKSAEPKQIEPKR